MTLPPGRDGGLLEIACDESGWEGENLVDSNTDVFAHAGVHVPTADATRAVLDVRELIRSPATEYKANHLLRRRHRDALEWLLGRDGPLYGRSHVHLVDKAYVVIKKVVDVLLAERSATAGEHEATAAQILYRDGRTTFGERRWNDLLLGSNALLRTKNDGGPDAPVDGFLAVVSALPAGSGPLGEIVDRLRRAGPRAHAYRTMLWDEPDRVPTLDPLAPAIVRTARHWSAAGGPLEIVHHQQNTLTPERIDQIIALLDAETAQPGRLQGIRLVDSMDDPRVQLADFLAGIARKVAGDELVGRGDPALTALLRPYVDPFSVWAEQRSWATLGPGQERTAVRFARGRPSGRCTPNL